jgi:hypothetical protein
MAPSCHPERSEGPLTMGTEMLRYAQHDKGTLYDKGTLHDNVPQNGKAVHQAATLELSPFQSPQAPPHQYC